MEYERALSHVPLHFIEMKTVWEHEIFMWNMSLENSLIAFV